ncbi:MAG TPA: DUF1489 domain-containing protein, partial [Agrobacterium sp.]|nr:DUF1489 domain-containing protein [Agrobacterium sp.]
CIINSDVESRQKRLDFRSLKGDDCIDSCNQILGPEVIQTAPAPKRPFQGWRYLKDDEAPRDLGGGGAGGEDMPSDLRRELAELGLL